MKIVLVGTANPYRGGGISTFNERLALEFQNQGHDIVIYNFTLQYPNFLFPGKSQYAETPSTDKVPTYRKVNSINPLNWIKIGLELKNMEVDLIIFRYWISFMAPCFGVIALLAKLNKKSKILTIIDNVIPHEKKFYDKPLTSFFFSACDKFVVMNSKSLFELKKFTLKPILLVPHPIYDNFGTSIDRTIAKEKLQLVPEEKIILFFGFIRDYKGLDLLLHAMSDTRILSMKIKLIIAGEFYSNKEYYLNLAKKLQLNNIIWHTEFIPEDEVSTYFCASDCVILPYKNATQSGVTQIAYHFLTPMIATKVGGLDEFVKDNEVGYLTEANSNSIADAIVRFYEEKKGENFIANIEMEKKQYEWHTFVSNILNYLTEK